MNPLVVYHSKTGNTKRFAQAVADAVNAPIKDLISTSPSSIESYDLLILGTPVEGASPAKETVAFIESMNRRDGAKAILFCTYRLFGNERTMKAMEKMLSAKDYSVLAKVSKKGMKPEVPADFTQPIAEVKKAISTL
jgi:flavodoxin